MKKRGQVTLFIILGVVLLLAVVLVIVLREKLTIFRPGEIFDVKTTPVQKFIEGCGDTVARDGLAVLGAQGGYIWLPPVIESNPLAHLDMGIKVPLWHYQTENRIPPMHLMEAHLSRYVTENLKDCLRGLSDFQKQYTIVEKGELRTETTITPQTVMFRIIYPIEIVNKEGQRVTTISEFPVDVPYKLKDMYEVGREVIEREAQEMKFEKMAVDLISMDSDIPLVGTEFSCAKKVWQLQEVQKKIKELLRTNIPTMRVEKTDYIGVPSEQPYVQNHYVWKVTETPYKDIRVTFTFDDNFPFFMAARPSSGQMLKSNELKGSGIASFVCLQQWKFVYDLQFPVLVTIEDLKNNYNLNYAFVVQVRNNRGERGQATQQMPFVKTPEESDEAYCGNTYGDYVMRVNTFDNVSDPDIGETHLPIRDVNISFTCLKFTCFMGQSKFSSGGAVARLEARFPYCVNGVLRGKKTGYKPYESFVTTTSGREVNVYLTPIKEIGQYKVVKHLLLDTGVTAARPLDSGEKAFISLKHFSNGTAVHETWGGYPLEKDVPPKALEMLAEGNFPYNVEIFVTKEDGGLVGGYMGSWQPTWVELGKAKAIEFHVLAKSKFASEAEMITFLGSLEKESKEKVPEPQLR